MPFARLARIRTAALTLSAAALVLPACQSVSQDAPTATRGTAPASDPNWALQPPTVAVERGPGGGRPVTAGAPGPVVPAGAAVFPGQNRAPADLPAIPAADPTRQVSPTYVPQAAAAGAAPWSSAGPDATDRFWTASRGWGDRAGCDRCAAGNDPTAVRPDWQNLPRLLGDQNRGLAGANVPSDLTSGGPRNEATARSSGSSAPGGGTNSSQQVLVELASSDGMTAFGATAGVRTQPNDSAQGLAPSLFVKRVLTSSDDGFLGVGFGGTLPYGDDSKGNVFPWLFGARRVTGDTWLQGVTGMNVGFGSGEPVFGYTDLGLIVPLAGRESGPRGAKLFFMPELHANYLISRGDSDGPGFVLNTTVGFGARYRGFDVQVGMAFPLLSERFYDYESILRITYRF